MIFMQKLARSLFFKPISIIDNININEISPLRAQVLLIQMSKCKKL